MTSVVAGVVARAFDRAAADYDSSFGANAAGLLFRHAVQERLSRLVRPGARVLDIGCGTGDDAVALAGRGCRVHAIDVAPAMVSACRAKAARAGLGPERLAAECRAAEDLAGIAGPPFDAAWSNFGALNCADLAAVGAGLRAVLRPGAAVLVSVMGPRPLPAALDALLRGRGTARGATAVHVGGSPVPVRYPTLRALRAALGSGFIWRRAFALGVLVPGPDRGRWPARHPVAFGLLAGLEHVVRGWPLLRGLGDHIVIEGVRA